MLSATVLLREGEWTMPPPLPSYDLLLFELNFNNKSSSIAKVANETSNPTPPAKWIIWSAFSPVIC